MEAHDLAQLEGLLNRAEEVRPLCEIIGAPRTWIGLRHDVDDRGYDSMMAMARWEAERGYRSTWYLLHTAPYWGPHLRKDIRELQAMGHEVGLHNNAIIAARQHFLDPFYVLEQARRQLTEWGAEIVSTAAHGDSDPEFGCHALGVVNYALFIECPPKPPWRTPDQLGFEPRSLEDCGFRFAGDHVQRGHYISDSGDEWNPETPIEARRHWPPDHGPLVILQHPDWYAADLFA